MKKPIYEVGTNGEILQNSKDGSTRVLTADEIVEFLNSGVSYIDLLIEMYGNGEQEFMFPDGTLWVIGND